MSSILNNLGNIKTIFTKLSLIFFQPNKVDTKQEWIYRGEGNANLVISLPNKRQILRIKKTSKSRTFLVWLLDLFSNYLTGDNGDYSPARIECEDLKFYKRVMMPLLGTFVCDAVPFTISRRQIDLLDRALVQCRPNYRKHKKLKCGKATFFTDFAFLPANFDICRLAGATYAVEIKPKQGWLPVDSRESKCKFCQNQYLKLAQGQIKRISGYCPLDLFSGDKNRMIKAIKSLIFDPQNNFKIFKNGFLAYGDQVPIDVFYDLLNEWIHCPEELSTYSLLEEFSELIYRALIKSMDKRIYDHRCSNSKDKSKTGLRDTLNSCDYATGGLPDGCILERILSVQKFDQLGLDYYKRLGEKTKLVKSIDYVEDLLREIDDTDRCAKCVINKLINKSFDRELSGDKFERCDKLEFVPYLVASVANDCSFMLTFRRILDRNVPNDSHVIKLNDNCQFAVNIGVFDLYPKPMSTIYKHFDRRNKMQKLSRS